MAWSLEETNRKRKRLTPFGSFDAGSYPFPTMIVQNPGNEQINYVFSIRTAEFDLDSTRNGFRYSNVDMSLDNNNGSVIP